jgi:hypothetical protein
MPYLKERPVNITQYVEGILNRHTAPVQVKCGTCTACCYKKYIEVFPDDEPPEHLAAMQLEEHDGHWLLPQRPEGGCRHLSPSGLRHLRAATVGLLELDLSDRESVWYPVSGAAVLDLHAEGPGRAVRVSLTLDHHLDHSSAAYGRHLCKAERGFQSCARV